MGETKAMKRETVRNAFGIGLLVGLLVAWVGVLLTTDLTFRDVMTKPIPSTPAPKCEVLDGRS